MYYLSCVNSCLPDFEIPRKYLNYQTTISLSNDELIELTALCVLLSPDVFEGKVFFNVDNDDLDMGGTNNVKMHFMRIIGLQLILKIIFKIET